MVETRPASRSLPLPTDSHPNKRLSSNHDHPRGNRPVYERCIRIQQVYNPNAVFEIMCNETGNWGYRYHGISHYRFRVDVGLPLVSSVVRLWAPAPDFFSSLALILSDCRTGRPLESATQESIRPRMDISTRCYSPGASSIGKSSSILSLSRSSSAEVNGLGGTCTSGDRYLSYARLASLSEGDG